MTAIRFFRSLVVALAVAVWLASTAPALRSQDVHGSKPNIILIVGDDVGWGDLGVCSGGDGRGTW